MLAMSEADMRYQEVAACVMISIIVLHLEKIF
jgi:hypothetical protein